MIRFLVSNNESFCLLTRNDKGAQKTTTKHLPSYYDVTKMPNNSNSLIFSLLIVGVHSYESKRMTGNKDSLTMITSITTKI